MQVNNAVIALTGESGDGIISLGDMLTRILAKMHINVLTFRTYPAEVRGGQCVFTVNAQQEAVLSQGNKFDILFCMDATAYDLNQDRLSPTGVLVYNKDAQIPQEALGTNYGVPIRSLVTSKVLAGSKNVLVLGVMCYLFNLDMEIAKAILSERWSKNAEVLKRNSLALWTGFEWAASNLVKTDGIKFEVIKAPERLLLAGNEAVCLGAVAAGCRFFAGYPITPASDILEWLMVRLPKVGGIVLQIEDEISAIGAALGAAYSGVRAMTATSGPGLALMTEFVNLAGSAEVPVVVVDVQRAGPSTGMPTKTEQSDLSHAAFGGPGESPRIVVAPTSVEDCFYQTMKAFNLADKYQLPVILLSDQSLSHRQETTPLLTPSRVPKVLPKRPSRDELKDYKRYVRTEDGVSPMSIPGMSGGAYVATGIERDESGMPNYDPETHELNTSKRMRKLERIAEEEADFEQHGPTDAKVGIISWGSTTGAVREATQMAVSRGLKVASFHPKLLYPIPRKQIGAWISNLDEVIVVEVNRTGQYHRMLQAEFGRRMQSFAKATGLPITPGEILSRLGEVARIGS